MQSSHWRAIRVEAQKLGVHVLILSRPESIYYLTGFHTGGCPTQALVIDATGRSVLVSRDLELSNNANANITCVGYGEVGGETAAAGRERPAENASFGAGGTDAAGAWRTGAGRGLPRSSEPRQWKGSITFTPAGHTKR